MARYWLALFQAHVDSHRIMGARVSELRVAETFAAMQHGAILGTPENIIALLRGAPFTVVFDGGEELQRANSDSVAWRDQNHFRPIADDMRRRARRLATDPWFKAITMALRFCLEGRADAENFIVHLARSVGEEAFLEEFMLPLLRDRALQRSLGFEKAEIFFASRFDSIFVPTTDAKSCEK